MRNSENKYIESMNESSNIIFKDYTNKVMGDIMQKRMSRSKQPFPARNSHRTSVSLDFAKIKSKN